MHDLVFNTLSKAQTRHVPMAWLQVMLDILVEALGRVNFGCVWDFKGLTSPDIKLNGEHHGSFCSIETHNHIHPGSQQHKLHQFTFHWPNEEARRDDV